MRTSRLAKVVVAVSAFAVVGSACSVSDMPLPGVVGTDDGDYTITAQIPNATNLVQNAPIMLNDATVGSVGKIEVKDWKAQVTMRLKKDAKIPAGSFVMVGMTSVLGSMHLQVVPPEKSQGSMSPGSTIPLAKCPDQKNISTPKGEPAIPDINQAQQVSACTYPSTEQVLSSLSVVLNGGGLSQIGDITKELNKTMTNRQDVIGKLIPRLNTLVGNLSSQRDNIITAMAGLDRLARTINEQRPTVQKALSDGPEILQLLVDQRPHLTDALGALNRLSKTTNDILNANSGDIKRILSDLNPFIDQLQASGPSLVNSLGMLGTFPFPEKYLDRFARGDYMNMSVTVDLTVERIQKSVLSSFGSSRLYGPEAFIGRPAASAKVAGNPFSDPVSGGGGALPNASGSSAPSQPGGAK